MPPVSGEVVSSVRSPQLLEPQELPRATCPIIHINIEPCDPGQIHQPPKALRIMTVVRVWQAGNDVESHAAPGTTPLARSNFLGGRWTVKRSLDKAPSTGTKHSLHLRNGPDLLFVLQKLVKR